jgi:hypothetical protein
VRAAAPRLDLGVDGAGDLVTREQIGRSPVVPLVLIPTVGLFLGEVEVTNQDTIEHNFTFAEANADQDVEGGEDATATFTAPAAGSYEFFCKYHPSAMRGTVTVT